MDIAHAIVDLYPNTTWTLDGLDYDGLNWDKSNTIPKPTREELESRLEELIAAEPMKLLREQRDSKLLECDWTQGEDVPESIKTKWKLYRQQLRDLPSTVTPKIENGVLTGFDWPQKPE
jgi:hypothetical protein